MEKGGRQEQPGPRLGTALLWEAARGGWVEVTGSSMEPLLPRGARIRVRPLPERVPLGALVLFPFREGLVVHRVVGRAPGGLRTKGDRAYRSDPGLRLPGEVLGEVAAARIGTLRAELGERRWRSLGLLVALASRAMDLLASPLPPRLLGTGEGWPGHVLRRLLRGANVLLPRAAARILPGLWRTGPGGDDAGDAPRAPAPAGQASRPPR